MSHVCGGKGSKPQARGERARGNPRVKGIDIGKSSHDLLGKETIAYPDKGGEQRGVERK